VFLVFCLEARRRFLFAFFPSFVPCAWPFQLFVFRVESSLPLLFRSQLSPTSHSNCGTGLTDTTTAQQEDSKILGPVHHG
jgi:hypothetical protein